jgi:hypothetical protein
VPSDFVLYGGTALAIQIGHRISEDFDFFSSSGFDADRLHSRLPFFRDHPRTDTDVPALSVRALQFFGDGTPAFCPQSIATTMSR